MSYEYSVYCYAAKAFVALVCIMIHVQVPRLF